VSSRARSRPPRLEPRTGNVRPAPPPTPAQLLERARVAGVEMGVGARELRSGVERTVAGDRRTLGQLAPVMGLSLVEAWDTIAAVFGATADRPQIDPMRTLTAFDRAIQRARGVAAAGGAIAFATARPASLFSLHAAIARTARAAGAAVDSYADAGPLRADGRSPRWVRWIEGVAVVTDGASMLGTNDGEPAREWLFLTPRPALAVVDGPYAEVAFEAGIEVVVLAGLDRVALGIAAGRSSRATVVPMRTDRPPGAYEHLTTRMNAV
jgi:hypothetical protein